VQERKKAEDMQQLISDASEFIQSGQRSSTYQMFERFSYACLFTGLGLPIEFDQMKLHDPRLIEQAERGKERLIQKMRQIETDRFLHSDLFLPS
jgi:hypothetical protein